MEQKGVNCTRGCSTIGMWNGFGSQCRSRTDAEVPKRHASSIEELIFFLGWWFLVVLSGMAPIHQSRIWEMVKATRRQRVKVERQSKATRETTAIIKSNGSDLMSEKGNLDFGSQIWFLRLKFWYICHRYVSGGGLATQAKVSIFEAKVSMWVFLITGIPCSANALQYATHWHHHMRRHFVALWRCFCLFFLQIQLHSTTTFQQDLKPCYFFFW